MSRPSTASSKSSLGIVPFGFHAKTSFDADDALRRTRSATWKLKESPKDNDIWKRPPPDFRYAVYDPQPPKRNTVDSMKPWNYGTIPGERVVYKREKTTLLPRILNNDQSKDEKEFKRFFRIDRPFTAKKKFVREGMYEAGEYEMPKPHDFRDYPSLKSLGLEELQLAPERDPYNLKFNSERLDIIRGLTAGDAIFLSADYPYMAPPLPRQPRFEPSLMLDRESYPQREVRFTRYRRRNRQAYSAFMERVEADLTAQWNKEKLEKVIQQAS
ncbi:uncharacterized protein LOC126832325 isoform X2 [Patella vulgata]|nr:uncharacterized protein LOC126832325 isoform X2 [Patella vulgata]XP_050419031.1 uncharacterized protein LOC126832325 isoform X2 [Patella vulgata]XP_050419032.1 uncharacterized protein LOC126832325 isoform X2 [Patella vulgata]